MEVWQNSMELSVKVFHLSNNFPRCEDYGLTSQLRRSSNSVTANIAEAFGRKTSADKVRFYYMSKGSVYETQSHLIYGAKVGYFEEQDCLLCSEYDQIIFDLNKIIKTLESKP